VVERTPVAWGVSASALKSFTACPRKWAFKAIGKVPIIPGPALVFGTAMHAEIEKYLTDGTVPNQLTKEGRLAFEGIPFLPRPGVATIEKHFTFTRADPTGPVEFMGYVDVWTSTGVIDHKSTSNPAFALSSSALRDDVQAVLYSAAWLTEHPAADATELRWLYYPKSKARVFPVDARLTRTETEERLAPLIPAGALMRDLRAGAAGLSDSERIERCNEIPCNPGSCEFVGRFCDFIHLCKITKEVDMASRVEELRARAASAGLVQNVPAHAAPPTPAPPPVVAAPPPVVAAPPPPVVVAAPPVAPVNPPEAPIVVAPVVAPVKTDLEDAEEFFLCAFRDLKRFGADLGLTVEVTIK
jgi:hypothetical protein